MRLTRDAYTRTILTVIALLLAVVALRPAAQPPVAFAATDNSSLYIEPGTTMLRTLDGRGHVQGKVVIDRRTGDVWGFPTATSAPYPFVPMTSEPPISKPMYLGRFDFSAMQRPE